MASLLCHYGGLAATRSPAAAQQLLTVYCEVHGVLLELLSSGAAAAAVAAGGDGHAHQQPHEPAAAAADGRALLDQLAAALSAAVAVAGATPASDEFVRKVWGAWVVWCKPGGANAAQGASCPASIHSPSQPPEPQWRLEVRRVSRSRKDLIWRGG